MLNEQADSSRQTATHPASQGADEPAERPGAGPATTARHPRRQGTSYPQHAALAIAAAVEDEPDDTEVARFCEALSGHKGRPVAKVRKALAGLRLPRGFRHARLFAQGQTAPFHRTSRRDARQVSVADILFGACLGRGGLIRWSTVEALGVVDRGVLDLAFDYGPPTA